MPDTVRLGGDRSPRGQMAKRRAGAASARMDPNVLMGQKMETCAKLIKNK